MSAVAVRRVWPCLARLSSASLSTNAQRPIRSQWMSGGHERRHFERRVLPFAPHELFNVVADVNSYSEFVPWCTDSRIVRRIDERHVAADLSVGFKMLSERYTSLVTLDPYHSVKVDVPHSTLFDYLINDWIFEKGPDKVSTRLCFYVEFRFRNPLYQRITDLFFNEVVKNMVTAFEKRAHEKYRQRQVSHDEHLELY